MIDEKDIERLKEIFVTRTDCRRQSDELDAKLAKDLVRLSVIETKLNITLGILGAIGGCMLTIVVKMLFGS